MDLTKHKGLPPNCSNFDSYCTNVSIQNICQVYQNPETYPIHSIIHFSVGALAAGRPLGGAVVFICGPSASGKSSTINALYQSTHSDLCKINGSANGVTTPICYSKQLDVNHNGSKCTASITLVDTPGLFDSVISNPAVTYATLSKTKNEMEALKHRAGQLNNFRRYKVGIRDDVYPNVILFTLKATENRILEDNSILRRSLLLLREVQNFIDFQHPNLIVVLTNCLALGQVQERFEQKLQEKVDAIRQVVKAVLGFDHVHVIPVENHAEDYDLEKMETYYKLPNNALSHQNLLVAMKACCSNNRDTLGEAVIRTFSDDKTKETGVAATQMDHNLNQNDLSFSEKHLLEKGICNREEYSATVFYFDYFGKGINPRVEKYTKESLLATSFKSESDIPTNLKTIEIGDKKFLVPACVQIFPQKKNHITRLTFIEQGEYDDHRKMVYGIESSINLVTHLSSTGKWVNKSKVMNILSASATINFAQVFQLATFKMGNPREDVVYRELTDDLQKLPEFYGSESCAAFYNFFEKWGTHMVSEQSVGGMIVLVCKVHLRSANNENLSNLTAAASTAFENLWSQGWRRGRLDSALEKVGVSDCTIKIVGGDKIESLDRLLTPPDLEKWKDTLPNNPIELRDTTRLFPYYDLIENRTELIASLRKATHAYLAGELRYNLFKLNQPSFDYQ